MAQQRTLRKKAPHLAFTDPHENEDSCVSGPDAQKSLSVHYENGNRKSTILDLVVNLAIFHIFTLNNLSQGFHQINFKLSVISTRWRYNLLWHLIYFIFVLEMWIVLLPVTEKRIRIQHYLNLKL